MTTPRNTFCAALGQLYDATPKAVFAAIAVSLATAGDNYLGDVQGRLAEQWRMLYQAGLVAQAPPAAGLVQIAAPSITDELRLSGYVPYAPSQRAEDADSRSCMVMECPQCRHVGLLYRPWSKPGSYRAFAACPSCGHEFEF